MLVTIDHSARDCDHGTLNERTDRHRSRDAPWLDETSPTRSLRHADSWIRCISAGREDGRLDQGRQSCERGEVGMGKSRNGHARLGLGDGFVEPGLLCEVVCRSPFPVGVFDTYAGRIVAASASALDSFGIRARDLDGYDPVVASDDPQANRAVLALIRSGKLSEWRFRTALRRPDGTVLDGDVAGRVLSIVGRRRLCLFAFPLPPLQEADAVEGSRPAEPASDHYHAIDRIDREIERLVTASEFVVREDAERDDVRRAAARVVELERRLLHIARELEAAGTVAIVAPSGEPARLPGLDQLSARQWEVLTRLLRGERVPTISRRMFLSASTVRNHLASIYRKVGVNSQAELLELMRQARAEDGVGYAPPAAPI
jgi:DNA-binding CsgD family transcriptional regulator